MAALTQQNAALTLQSCLPPFMEKSSLSAPGDPGLLWHGLGLAFPGRELSTSGVSGCGPLVWLPPLGRQES